MALELSELTLEEALRSYSSVKGHRTRTEREIGNLLRLLKEQYSVSEYGAHAQAQAHTLAATCPCMQTRAS